ncbi:peptide MFS transporter [Xanthocytophaga flava]|uniref:peptide MFS transporter n=1 Tax=Xanthocytophaga flava TaxID=3048013 RepID=UPI0028D755E1|nr:peptide MFS transporter [Xanthocytophaga flavus]MDJ1472960.1 peptide MFS transporter [Xanthocytophaga flavus]
MATATGKEKFTQPAGLYVLFLTEMWERFSYYGMRAILILFMTEVATKGGMELSAPEAAAVYALYTSSVYLLSLPGGWLADSVFGQRRTIWYGGITIMLGHIILAIPGDNVVFFCGLAVVAIGTGLLKPNISSIVGELYPEGGSRRDAGFSIFYMGINLGGFLGQTVVAFLGEKVNWHWGFGAAAVGMFIGLVIFKFQGQKHLSQYGNEPKEKIKFSFKTILSVIVILGALAILLIVLHLTHVINAYSPQGLAQVMKWIIIGISCLYFFYILILGNLSLVERKRVVVLMVLFIAAALFWSGFEQAGSSLNLFASRYVDRDFLGSWQVPAGWLQNFNQIFIIIFAPLMAALWINLGRRNLNPNVPAKFALGLILMGLGFLVMVFAAKIVVSGEKAAFTWLIMTYFLHTIGELCLSPVGLSTYTKLAPKQFVSQMMGVWFVAAALGNLFAGLFAGNFDKDNVQQMPDLFMSVVYLGVGSGLFLLVFSKPIKKWMGGVE